MQSSIVRLRYLAIIGVVMIHVNSPFLSKELNDFWIISNILSSISRFSVPVFLMITGALLLGKEESLAVFYKKRAGKVMIPFLLWSVFYYYYHLDFEFTETSASEFILMFVSGNIHYHFWYLYMLVLVYLFIPILQKIIQISTEQQLIYYMSICFLYTIFNATSVFIWEVKTEWSRYSIGFSPYIGYLLLGYLIYQKGFLIRFREILYALGMSSLFITIYGTYILKEKTGDFHPYFYGHASVTVILFTAALMVFVIQMKNEQVSWVTKSIAGTSFEIYLIHPVFVSFFTPYIKQLELTALFYFSVLFVVVFSTSYLTSLVINQVKRICLLPNMKQAKQ